MSLQSSENETRRASLADVARLAGCSPATVSRRLNNPSAVGPDVTRAIDNAIEELGYVRNESARSLRASRSRLVGVIVPSIRHSIYADLLCGLQTVLEKNGFALIHNTSDYNLDEEYKQARTLVERGVEALVLVGLRHRGKLFELLKAHNVTCVITYALQEDFKISSVGFDNRRAAGLAATRLYELGHRRFAMLAGITANNDRAQARVDGFVETLKTLGVSKSDIMIREADYQIKAGQQAMASLLDEDAQRPTALFCGSDVLAIGAMAECRRRDIRVPEDMSIIGFDNLEISAYVYPPLSTLNVPAYEMGEEAAKYICHSEPGRTAPKRIELNVEYVDRGTTQEVAQPVNDN
ncbi:LacI family DNA-binding transcriptional regulator [Klebsiella variicola]|uniref:LacI family DNA-binding transcriptional regulator n=1 Tax=Klebsiella variicola TaxID=244366 RepID=UPI001C250D22|nr:LacI family DNA-binding transcriptional regulator [Klebsiella variicola]MBU9731530.1 LacI family DNA-binding transcriptional regulator [Klebsiella variicola]